MMRYWLCSLLFLGATLLAYSDDSEKPWDWLSWSADPKHYTGKGKLPSGTTVLYYKDEPVGILFLEEGVWLSLSTGEEYNLKEKINKYNPKKPKDPKVVPKVKEEIDLHDKNNFGVDLKNLHDNEVCTYDGSKISLSRAVSLIKSGPVADDIPDDSGKCYLTVIGDDSDVNRVKKDLQEHPNLSQVKKRLIVKFYPKDHWRVTSGGFVNTGRPTIYLQDNEGKVLWRQDNYEGGADSLYKALRDRIPNYDPNKDPGPNPGPNPGPTPLPQPVPIKDSDWLKWLQTIALVAGIGFVIYLSLRK